MGMPHAIGPNNIATCEKLIRPHIRRTPVIEIDAADFKLAPSPLWLKLELLQHSGSFKARGAFANLLMRKAPSAGVVAASGGNHGAAVAYAAMRLQVPAKIFVPSVSSPAKIARIRDYGADLVIEGDRYADALAASELWVEKTEQCQSMPSTRMRPCWGRARSAWSLASRRPTSTRSWLALAAAASLLESLLGIVAASKLSVSNRSRPRH
jgi:threonine dehydratase